MKKIFRLRDSKAGAYLNLFTEVNEETAKRSVLTEMRSENSHLRNHAEDFQLYLVGRECDDTGRITPIDPEHICNVIDLVPNDRPRALESVKATA